MITLPNNLRYINGLLTVVAQHAHTGEVLMVAQADEQALQATQQTGYMHYTSRRRGLWRKGETSGNTQRVVRLVADCDGDALLALVIPAGPACHALTSSCFVGGDSALLALDATIRARQAPAATGYTARLLREPNLRLKKIGEECAELLVALGTEQRAGAVMEAADLFYHVTVALGGLGLSAADVLAELGKRSKVGPAHRDGDSLSVDKNI